MKMFASGIQILLLVASVVLLIVGAHPQNKMHPVRVFGLTCIIFGLWNATANDVIIMAGLLLFFAPEIKRRLSDIAHHYFIL